MKRRRGWTFENHARSGRISMNDQYYHDIAARATTLRERIDDRDKFVFHREDDMVFNRRLTGWKEAIAPRDPAMFLNRLANDGIGEKDLPGLLGKISFRKGSLLPSWVDQFRKLMDFLNAYNASALEDDMKRLAGDGRDKTIPFLHLLTPVLAFSEMQLEKNAGNTSRELFTLAARQMRCRQLAGMLGLRILQCFQEDFTVFRTLRQFPLERMMALAGEGAGDNEELYSEFTGNILNGGWTGFFAEYPMAARTLAVITRNWERNSAGFAGHLKSDLPLITGTLAGGISPGKVTAYRSGISDPHDKGKTVISLEFESGFRLVYKPRNLDLEPAWSELIGWLNRKGLNPSLKPLSVIARPGYGWTAFVGHSECASEEEVKDYYRRVGALTGIIYLLNGNDFHMENLIAAGAWPVPVDLESVMHHEGHLFPEETGGSAGLAAVARLRASVYRTGLLPSWLPGRDGSSFDISGAGSYGQGESITDLPRWNHINTDAMELTFLPVILKAEQNLPAYRGEVRLCRDYSGEIVSGFTTVYRLIQDNRDEIPIRIFRGKELRFIFRATKVYALILKKLSTPEYMRDGIIWSIHKESLCRPFLYGSETGAFWPVCLSELRQTDGFDIPVFRADSGSTVLKDPGGLVCSGLIPEPAYDTVAARLSEMDGVEMENQVRFIRAALFLRDIRHGEVEPVVRITKKETSQHGRITQEALVRQALSIAGRFKNEAIFSDDGSCSWIAAGIVPGTERYRMQPVSMNLYDGLPGIALFLSALFSISGDKEVGNLNQACLKAISNELKFREQRGGYYSDGPAGITTGIPSVVYSLIKISEILQNPSFLDEADCLARQIPEILILNNPSPDIMSGSAGCILSLLTLYRSTGSREILEKAVHCGDHLIGIQCRGDNGSEGWRTLNNRMLAGFANGQAGIAYALLRLWEASGNPAYREAALRGIRYENSLFRPEYGNWEDLRDAGPGRGPGPRFMTGWCHGAPGIGLARMAGQRLANTEDTDTCITAAMKTTLEAPVSGRDHLCCGNTGRMDILLCHSIKKQDNTLKEIILSMAGQIIERAQRTGRFDLFPPGGEEMFNPGFFLGLSGIGYAFLRLACPAKFPSVLTFD